MYVCIAHMMNVNAGGYKDIRVDFRDFRFVIFQDFSTDLGFHERFLKCYTRFQGSFESGTYCNITLLIALDQK